MANATIPIPSLSGGVATTAPAIRGPAYVEDAENVMFSVRTGLSKRPGSWMGFAVDSTESDKDYLLHAIHRDDSDRYLMVYGREADGMIARVFATDGTEATVSISPDAQDYLDAESAEAGDLRIATLGDDALILNTLVTPLTETSPAFAIEDVYENWEEMTGNPFAYSGRYFQTESATNGRTAGYWRCEVPAASYRWTSDPVHSDWRVFIPLFNRWVYEDRNPSGFTVVTSAASYAVAVHFDDGEFNWLEDATYNLNIVAARFQAALRAAGATTATITHQNYRFTIGFDDEEITDITAPEAGNYDLSANADRPFYFDDGTGGTGGGFALWYGATLGGDWNAASDYWNDNGKNPMGFSVTFTDGDGADHTYTVKENFQEEVAPAASMKEIASRLQAKLRAAGAADAQIWYDNGRFVIAAPYRGDGAAVKSITAHTDAAVYDLSASGRPFRFAEGTAEDGSGDWGDDEMPLDDRFTRVPPPDQPNAVLDETTLPVKLTRTAADPLAFEIDTVEWGFRETGTDLSNPAPDIFTEGAPIVALTAIRNRLAFGANEHVALSQAGEFYKFYLEDVDNLGDADPIKAVLPGENVPLVDMLVPFRKTLVIFTKSGEQMELTGGDTLTYNTAAISPSTTCHALPSVRPVAVGNTLYFMSSEKGAAQLREYYFSDPDSGNVADDVSGHARGFLPPTVQTLAACVNDNSVFMLPANGSEFYTFRSVRTGRERAQAAFGLYSVDSTETIADLAVIAEDIWLLCLGEVGHFVVHLAAPDEAAESGWPYHVHLDNKVTVTGVYADGTTTFTLTHPDDLLDTMVLGPDFEVPGQYFDVTRSDSTTYTIEGDYTDGEVVLGRSYAATALLSRPHARDSNGAPILDAVVRLHKLVLNHANTGGYSVRVAVTGRTSRDYTFSPRGTDLIESEGSFQTLCLGDAKHTALSIRDASPLPFNIPAGEFVVSFNRRSR